MDRKKSPTCSNNTYRNARGFCDRVSLCEDSEDMTGAAVSDFYMRASAAISHLTTSGCCPMHNRMPSALMRRPQQGRENNTRMKMLRWRMMPTRSRFLPPNVCTTVHTALIIFQRGVMHNLLCEILQTNKFLFKPETPVYQKPEPDRDLLLQWWR